MECASCGNTLTEKDEQPYCEDCWKEVYEESKNEEKKKT